MSPRKFGSAPRALRRGGRSAGLALEGRVMRRDGRGRDRKVFIVTDSAAAEDLTLAVVRTDREGRGEKICGRVATTTAAPTKIRRLSPATPPPQPSRRHIVFHPDPLARWRVLHSAATTSLSRVNAFSDSATPRLTRPRHPHPPLGRHDDGSRKLDFRSITAAVAVKIYNMNFLLYTYLVRYVSIYRCMCVCIYKVKATRVRAQPTVFTWCDGINLYVYTICNGFRVLYRIFFFFFYGCRYYRLQGSSPC